MLAIFHTSTSVIFLISAVFSLIRYYTGWQKKLTFTKYDKLLATILLTTLYIQMFIGVYLFYTKLNGKVFILNNSLENRFWPVEHLLVMFFAIIIAHIGYVYSNNINNNKFKALAIYYTASLILVLFSLGMIMF